MYEAFPLFPRMLYGVVPKVDHRVNYSFTFHSALGYIEMICIEELSVMKLKDG